MNDAASQIKHFNAGRDPERLALKLAKMRADPFVFLRGSCHLFYARMPRETLFTAAPLAWLCGDLHLENFGSFKGDNRLAYFDINDFDEAILAPCTLDLVRFLASVQLGARSLQVSPPEAGQLCRVFIDAYAAALAEGKARWVERETAVGLVKDLLAGLGERKRPAFLDTRTELKGKLRRIRCDGRKALPADDARRAEIEAFITRFAASQLEPGFYRPLDVARRIAGTGSLGVERYIVLVEGKGSPDGNYLLDLKEALPSSLAPWTATPQPPWPDEANRVVTLQQRLQAIPMAFLQAVELGGKPFILRDLQPSEDRVALDAWNGKLRRLEEVLATMGQVLAWAHLRSAGRQGSAIADAFVDLGQRSDWQAPLIEQADAAAAMVLADWQAYSAAFDAGYFA
ncbi:MAG: DUF2252 domain-containing protein [Zoogloea sp.]|uniref:DUF2252 domain-containing protein n=1 Tax=Zoogloea sp. TaxID=49181 RepID=UPI00260B01C8|nr:DUF2252 domain-containing protein [Zoogloea sp.]MDD3325660.1 DUF2252 domain-containing protein [Zoogloea sp.]